MRTETSDVSSIALYQAVIKDFLTGYDARNVMLISIRIKVLIFYVIYLFTCSCYQYGTIIMKPYQDLD